MTKVSADVFVLDDNQDFRFFVQRGIEIFGYSCAVFGNSEAALKALGEAGSSPKLILVDFYMPDGSAADFIATLRKLTNGRELKVILLSGVDSIQEKSAAVGANAYLKKPFDLQQLKMALEAFVPKTT